MAELFEPHRRHLWAVAYRMLGAAADADDIVQEAYLRARATPPECVESPRAYLTTIVTRLCLDHWKSARVQRETYVGPWLPEPVFTPAACDETIDPASISLAFLVLLESLSPVERAAYLLREVFDYSHAEVARIVGRDEVSCRQLVHRARERVVAQRPRFAPTHEAHARLLFEFARACAQGDLAGLERLLAEDVRATSDGGGKVHAAQRPIVGANRVARLYLGIFKLAASSQPSVEIAQVNGLPALVVRVLGTVKSIVDLETDGERILSVRAIVNPDKLAGLAVCT
ncbi:MAG: polymerase sigma-70 factor [Myxococcaceae bacterium]|nr:polymerase sigma-70 factor [Myxococcaceae bacterium]